MTARALLPLLLLSGLLPGAFAPAASWFEPKHRLSGIGTARQDMDADLLDVRVNAMVQSQTFAIMREPQALAGAKRITAPKLQALFRAAEKATGLPASTIEAIAYLESWGDPKAASPAGPRGIMQISESTARRMGLKVVHATRYRVVNEKVTVKRGGKTTYKVVKRKTPYTVTLRDDRLTPDRAVPAAARYLAGLEQRYGGRDWAIFAYHCGEGCVAEMMEMTRQAHGIPRHEFSVARMFFSCSPAWNRDLYDAVRRQMERDYSPTYWFRIQRAEQLLALYRRDAAAFTKLAAQYKSDIDTGPRAPHRLAVWLRRGDFTSQRLLVRVPDRPDHFGFELGTGMYDEDRQASASAIGTLAYIAFETRRLHEAMHPRGEKFQPLQVTSLMHAADRASSKPEALSHATGEVFDVHYSQLPPGERECLRFVLSDLGWQGYLGFVEEAADTTHIGCAPTAREFFTAIYEEMAAAANGS